MEIGAVLGQHQDVQSSEKLQIPGDIIILRRWTYRNVDGCGGATGSSKVQYRRVYRDHVEQKYRKGNAPTERKIQRLFRREEVSKLIKNCNDFGAGGVSVAIGELADGLRSTLIKYLRNMPALTEQRLQSLNHRNVWQLL